MNTHSLLKGVWSAAGALLLAGSVGVVGAMGVGLATAAVSSASGAPVAIATTSLPSGVIGHSYSATVGATGGEAPYSWSATTLPAGLHISGTGKITGTPTTGGKKTVHLTVTSHGSSAVAYDSLPTAPNQVTFAQDYEAHGIAELGNQITLKTTTSRALGTVVVQMVNFSTKAYTETITFNIYNVASTDAVGGLITSKTQKFAIPAGTPDPSIFTITFNMATADAVLPSTVIYGIAFSTGPGPNGSNGSSYPEGGLAVGLSYTTTNVTVGSDPLHGTGSDYIDVTDANGGTNSGGGYTANFCTGAGTQDVTQFVYDPGVGGTQPCVGTQALNHHTTTPTPYLPVPEAFVPAVKLVTAPSTASKTLPLTISPPAPTITSVSRTGPLSGGNTVTITGTGFSTVQHVKFGTTTATSYSVRSATQLLAVAPAHAAGNVRVSVTTAGGTSQTTPADVYRYASPLPAVTSISPASGAAAGNTIVTVNGSGFTGATKVTFGGATGSSISVNAAGTQLTVKSPAGTAGSSVDVQVTTSGGTSLAVTADKFTYGPTLTSLSRVTGAVAGGTRVTITGSGFETAQHVKFGTTTAASFTIKSDTQITVSSPAHLAGQVRVSVTTSAGTTPATSADLYTYH